MNILQNIKKSQQLQSEVEAFLASGGRINQLSMGETQHSKGYVPQISAITIKPQGEAKPNEPKPSAAAVRIRAQLKEQNSVMIRFNRHAKNGHYAVLARMAGVPRSAITNLKKHAMLDKKKWEKLKKIIVDFDFSLAESQDERLREQQRRNKVHAAKRQAVLKGERVFIGPCKKHGESEYRIDLSGHSHCIECRREQQRNYRNKNEG